MTKAKTWLDRRPEYNELLLDAVKEWGMNNRDIIHSCDYFGNHPYEVIEWAYNRGKEQGKKDAYTELLNELKFPHAPTIQAFFKVKLESKIKELK